MLFESSSDAIFMQFPPDWEFVSCNRAGIELFGAKSSDDFLPSKPELLSPESQPDGISSADKAVQLREEALIHGYSIHEWTFQKLTGELFTALVTKTRITLDNMTFLQTSLRDISYIKNYISQIINYSNEQKNLVDTRDKFISLLAHDLKNPFNAILGYSDMLLSSLPEDTNSTIARLTREASIGA